VSAGLHHRHHLVERVQVVEVPFPARPGQRPRRLVSGGRALPDDRGAGVQAPVMVPDQLVDPRVRAVSDAAVRGQQPQVRQGPDQAQRAQVVAERQLGPARLEADRRRDVRQHVVASEQQAVA